jgi:hypothetical protein
VNYRYTEDKVLVLEPTKEQAHDAGLDCGEVQCQQCCPHDEYDHYICLDCGYEKDPGEDIDAAMDYYKDNE